MKKIKHHIKKFNSQFKNSAKTAIIAAAGLITANSWKSVFEEYLLKIEAVSPFQGKILVAILMTISAAIIVALTSRALK